MCGAPYPDMGFLPAGFRGWTARLFLAGGINQPRVVLLITAPDFVNSVFTMWDRKIITPIAVPSVFVITSVRPELRVGRNACRSSIVRLVHSPTTTVVAPGYFIVRVNER